MSKITMVCLVLVGLAGWLCGCEKKSETAPPAEPTESTEMTEPVSPPAEPAVSTEMMAPTAPPSTMPAEMAATAPAAAKTDTPLAPEPGTQVVTLAVTGMHCDACAQTICQELGKVPGVRKAHASFPAKTAWVMIDKTGGPGVEQLVKAVETAGYKAAPAVGAGPTSSAGL